MPQATGNNTSIFTNTKCQIVTNGYSRSTIADCSANALYGLYGLRTGSVSWEILHDIPFGEPEFRNVSLWAWLGRWGQDPLDIPIRQNAETKSESLKDLLRKPRQSIALKLQGAELAEALPAIEEAVGQCSEPIATEFQLQQVLPELRIIHKTIWVKLRQLILLQVQVFQRQAPFIKGSISIIRS